MVTANTGAVAVPQTQRITLCTISRYPYLMTEPKNFLKAPLVPIYTNFALAEKARFCGQHFPKRA